MAEELRIVSLVPGATEVVAALGRRPALVGVTHECAGVADVEHAEIVTRCRVPATGSGSAIDGAVKTAAANRDEIVVFDGQLIARLRPELVILPPVAPADAKSPCVPDPAELRRVVGLIDPPPRPLTYAPTSTRELLGSVRALGEAVGRGAEAARLVAELRTRIESVRGMAARAMTRPRVALLAWTRPPIGAGGLLAELVQLAGGRPVVGDPAEAARPLDWGHVAAMAPEVIIVAPCSFPLNRAREEADALAAVPELRETPAARWGQVHAVDARRYFSAAGTSTVRALEILATLVHPELPWPESLLPGSASRPVPVGN